MITFKVEYETHFDSLQKQADIRAKNFVRKAAFDIEGLEKEYIAVDTGFARNAIFTEQVDDMVWEVVSPAFYSVFLEFGTVKMAPQPFVTPAVEQVRPDFERNMRSLL